MGNTMYLKVPALSKNEAFVRNTVAAFCVDLNPTVDQIDDIKTAVSEAVTNSVVHAYENEVGDVEVFVEIIDSTVHIRITDFGKGIRDIQKATTHYFSTDDSGERAGIGFTVMQSFMDEMEVKNKQNGRGVTIILWKNLIKED